MLFAKWFCLLEFLRRCLLHHQQILISDGAHAMIETEGTELYLRTSLPARNNNSKSRQKILFENETDITYSATPTNVLEASLTTG